MDNPIKILYIDPDYKVIYVIVRSGAYIQSTVPLDKALDLIKTEEFDLIISEPQNIAILNPVESLNRVEQGSPVDWYPLVPVAPAEQAGKGDDLLTGGI